MPRFPQRRVILVAEPVVQGQILPDLPFVLCIDNVILLKSLPDTGRPVVERARGAHIVEELHLLQPICEEVVQIRIRVGRSALPVGIHPHETDFPSELKIVISLYPAQVVDYGL